MQLAKGLLCFMLSLLSTHSVDSRASDSNQRARAQRSEQYEATLQCTSCERVIGYISGHLTAGLSAKAPQRWTKSTHLLYKKELQRKLCKTIGVLDPTREGGHTNINGDGGILTGVCLDDDLFPATSPDYAEACIKFVVRHTKAILLALKHRLHSGTIRTCCSCCWMWSCPEAGAAVAK